MRELDSNYLRQCTLDSPGLSFFFFVFSDKSYGHAQKVSTVEPLISGHHRGNGLVSANWRCPSFGGYFSHLKPGTDPSYVAIFSRRRNVRYFKNARRREVAPWNRGWRQCN